MAQSLAVLQWPVPQSALKHFTDMQVQAAIWFPTSLMRRPDP